MNKYRKLVFACLVSTAIPFNAHAVDNYFPGVVDRNIPDTGVPKKYDLNKEAESPVEKEKGPKAVQDPSAKVAKFDSVQFEGNTKVSDVVLNEIASPYLGRVITKGELADLKYKLTKAYYDKGFILVKVTTPPQKVQNGVLHVNIYEAEVGRVVIDDPNDVVRDRIPTQMGMRIPSGAIIREKPLESMISDINDLDGIGATLNLEPGQEFKTTDLRVALRKEKDENNKVTVDNYGSELTGEWVASAHLEKGDLLKLGELLTLDARHSDEELWSVKGGVETPIGIRNIILESSYMHSENEIGGRLSALNADGTTDVVNAALSSKFINTVRQQVVGRVGFEMRRHESDLAGVPNTIDDLRRVYLNSTFLSRLERSVWYGSLTVSKDIDAFGASNKGDALASRAKGDPEAWRIEPLFVVNFRPRPNDIVKFVASGQWSSDPLLSSDEFILGGYGNVRGFEPAQEAGDAGYQLSLEYNHEFHPNPKLTLRVGPFFDMGAVYNRLISAATDDHLYSAGLGAEARAQLFKVGETFARFDWAHPIGDYKSTEVDDDTFYVQVGQSF